MFFFINVFFLFSSRKWSRLITDSYPDDHQYSALLGVAKADFLDSGVFTCQVVDSNVQQCLSLKVSIKTPPTIKIQPLSLTVKKVFHAEISQRGVLEKV